MTMKKTILLVEDNSDDELLTIRALKKNHLVNDIIVVRDGAEALDYLLGKNTSTNLLKSTGFLIKLLAPNP